MSGASIDEDSQTSQETLTSKNTRRTGQKTSPRRGTTNRISERLYFNGSRDPLIKAPPSVTNHSIHELEETVKVLHLEIQDKRDVIESLEEEVKKMRIVFHRLLNPKLRDSLELTKGGLDRGPFTLVFHGVEPDWIETEMEEDEAFKKGVLETRMRNLLREEVGMDRESGIKACSRYKEGPKIHGHPPVIVSFKSRRDKESAQRRCKDSQNLKNKSIFVTEDSQIRLLGLLDASLL